MSTFLISFEKRKKKKRMPHILALAFFAMTSLALMDLETGHYKK